MSSRAQAVRARGRGLRLAGLVSAGVAAAALAANPAPDTARSANSAPSKPSKPPETAREYVNAGTAQLGEGKLKEAEGYLEMALATQVERVQPTALYNLGHVRFGQGVEDLKKSPPAGPTTARSRAAAEAAEQAVANAQSALAGNEMDKLVAAYMQGRGVRKQLRDAKKAVAQAMQAYGSALRKWQRSSGDFKSTLELNRADADARHNAEVVDRSIAKLVDSLREMQQAASQMGDKQKELGEKMKELRGRIPEENMPPGAPGDEEEEEDQPKGPEPGQQEGPSRPGEEKEIPLSPEQASWLLEGFRLDADRRLPMGEQSTAEPRNRNRPTW